MITKTEIEAMSVDERMQLLELLWESIGPRDTDVPEWQRKILAERLAEMEKYPEREIPWPEARRALKARQKHA